MELLKLSKFKLQLRALIAEVRDLRQRERSANEKIVVLDQNKKHTQDEYFRKFKELETELASSNDLRQKLERKVSYLQNDYALLESKQNELKATINSLLQSRESFINAYEESFYEAKRLIAVRDRKLTILSEKIDSFSTLFESIEKEALSVKQVVDNVRHLVSEKEGVVTGLRSKLDQVSAYEKLYIEKISDLEDKLKNNEEEFSRKNKIISELEEQLEAAAIKNNHHTQTQELQKFLSTKDLITSNLISEKQALQSDILTLRITLQKIQSNITALNWEQISLMLEDHDRCDLVKNVVNRSAGSLKSELYEEDRIKDQVPKSRETSQIRSWETDSPHRQECTSVGSSLPENNYDESNAQELVFEPFLLASQSISVKDEKENEIVLLHPFDSVSSTTNTEISQAPGGS